MLGGSLEQPYQTDSGLDGRVTMHELEIKRNVVDGKEERGTSS